MKNELKPYGDYKEVNLIWVDKVPLHWEVVSNKEIWSERTTKNCVEEELLSVTIKKGLIRQEELIKNSAKKDSSNLDKSNYKLVLENDIVYNKMRMWQGAVGNSKFKGIVSPAYVVLKSRIDLNSKYFHYLLRTPDYIEESHRYSYGICDDQLNLRYEDFKGMKNILPPKIEQDQIVKYLDYRLARINKFIKAKKKLILTLKEQKQAVINEAVTKGINPDVRMKTSGIEWLGDIPEHWSCKKIKRVAKLNPSKSSKFKKYSLDDKVVFLAMDKISVYGEIDNSEKRSIRETSSGFTYFEQNDVVIAKITPCFENGKGACLKKLESEIGYGTTELIILRTTENILPDFLYWITRISYFRIFGVEVMTGAAGQKRVPSDFVANFELGIPNVVEQKMIVEFITSRTEMIDKSIKKINQEIDLITEYRTRLISDVVTGKIDVRNIVIDEEQIEDVNEINTEVIDTEELLDNEGCDLNADEY